ncbi:MAG TPA: hypothetical protein VKS79_04490, partial [Gemmataceae bacterium]|nr:hypothetical protein [Gemmataceae bacterium]
TLLFFPRIVGWAGVRGTMCIGLLAAVLTLGGLMIGDPLEVAIGGLSMYGFCIGCYLVAGQMFLNHRAREDTRASAQALHSVLCGIGLLIGNLLVGFVRLQVQERFVPTFAVATGIAALLLAVFVVGFPRDASA